jgi:hypothetical protein
VNLGDGNSAILVIATAEKGRPSFVLVGFPRLSARHLNELLEIDVEVKGDNISQRFKGTIWVTATGDLKFEIRKKKIATSAEA